MFMTFGFRQAAIIGVNDNLVVEFIASRIKIKVNVRLGMTCPQKIVPLSKRGYTDLKEAVHEKKQHNISETACYKRKTKYGMMTV